MLQILARRDKGPGLIGRLRTLPVDPERQSPVIDVATRFRFQFSFFGWSFILCVLLPVLVSTGYHAFVASNEYVSEAKFTIRKASESRSSLIGDAVSNISASMGMGMGGQATSQDVYIVADYIRGRSIIEDLGGKSFLYNIYSSSDIDWLSRLSPSASLEKAWKYWKNKIDALIDTPSGVITLEVQAFTRDDAHHLAEIILKKNEELVNNISERSRHDALMRAQSEVQLAEDRLRKARAALLAFRNTKNLIDPSMSAKSISEAIGKLTQDRLVMENNRATLKSSVTADSPTLRVLTAQIDAIDKQIENLKNQLTSQTQDTAISSQIAGYENLQIEGQFAEKLYSIAQSSYETARTEQERQQLYLVTIDQPSLPQTATYPKVFLDSVTMFAACFILWSIVSLLIATVKDHMGG
jgi:capsular polysaccharide transport system permease protein